MATTDFSFIGKAYREKLYYGFTMVLHQKGDDDMDNATTTNTATTLTETELAARRKYKREWARRNPDKVQQHQKTFWAKQSQKDEAGRA